MDNSEQLKKIFSLEYANKVGLTNLTVTLLLWWFQQREINKVNIQEMVKQLQSREGDIGSTPVQSIFSQITLILLYSNVSLL